MLNEQTKDWKDDDDDDDDKVSFGIDCWCQIFFTGQIVFLSLNGRRQSTEGVNKVGKNNCWLSIY